VLKDVTPPPGVNLDSVGDTYEMSGCDKKLLMVCAHPVEGAHPDPFSAGVKQGEYGTELSLNTEYFTLVRALSVDGGRVSSVVVCQPGGAAPQ
jgi:hypothetical protein